MPLNDLRTMCMELSELLWAVHKAEGSGLRLIFPKRRDGVTRISEQESKMILCQLLERSQWFYSVETPTTETYQQQGNDAISGRSDISLYATHSPESKRANVELKAHGTITVEDFRKDFEKALRENLDTLWFHTLENTNRGTFPNVFRKIREAFALLKGEIDRRSHSIVFAFCVLERRELWLTTVTLAGSAEEQLRRIEAALDHSHLRHPPRGGWIVHRGRDRAEVDFA
jgi:hypothetical protein